MKIKYVLNRFESFLVNNILTSDKLYYSYVFFRAHKKLINWNMPESFSEKIFWRKLHQRNEKFSLCSDKYHVRSYVSEVSQCDLIPLIGHYECWGDINFDLLPDSFVIKTTHDSGGVVIVRDKINFDKKKAKKVIEASLSKNYGKKNRESHYSLIEPKIIIEELLLVNNELPNDIKVHCFNGEPKFIQVANPEHTTNDIFDFSWNRLTIKYKNENSKHEISRPQNIDDIYIRAKELCKDFDYVRVDLYHDDDKVFFGELTFTPNDGTAQFTPKEINYEWGRLWELDRK
ncbi:ATP-grasp fold amidoligase family protein [Vibrio cyclitrophicus]|uniref:ATP-grasp fold amidoligase family protein n=1 Tax=Vibrio cyclitrophicus TaxID=47951 RepID=UPI00080E86EB|nr:ATP-grasp fold amidoligase family protein [Vibrio cyclitrophicus]OCH40311.1 hypothetical protein A6E07_10995 [Vibrio cyclitrophicus]